MSAGLGATGIPAHEALTSQAALLDRSSRMRMSFSGERAKEVLGGLLTNDIASLKPGDGMRAAALTPKGRVIALLRVFDRGGDLLVDTDPAAGAGFILMIRKYVNPRLARHAELTAATGALGIYGPASVDATARLSGVGAETLRAMAPHGNTGSEIGGEPLTVVRSIDFGVEGFDVIASTSMIATLAQAGAALGLPTIDEDVAEVARIEAGVPRWGIEMDEDTLPQEANLDLLGAISFNKGCYTGQEVVARIHFRGHVNKVLRRLHAGETMEPGASVRDPDGKDVGTVRSAASSPTRGAIALAMVRREVAPGSEVLVALADGRAIRAMVEPIA